MSFVREPSKWNNDAALLLKQFLATSTGRLFLLHLDYLRPDLSSLEVMESVALKAKLVEGYERAISNVISLSMPQPKEGEATSTVFYKDLDDDTQWDALPKREEAPAPVPAPKTQTQPQPQAQPAIASPAATPKKV